MDNAIKPLGARLRDAGLIVEIGWHSDRGPRAANEDYAAGILGDALHGAIAALADGVGGSRGGRVAAELAVRSFVDALATDDPMRGAARSGTRALEAINRWINAVGTADPALAGMACTFTALVLRGRRAHVLHVGDSRLYRLRDGALTRLTTDHAHGAMRNQLTRALGIEAELRLDLSADAARVHDRYMLCSDGVHGYLSDRAIAEELGRRAAPEETARHLVAGAFDASGTDNATAMVVDIVALPQANQLDLEAAVAALPIAAAPRAGMTVDGYALATMLSDGRYSRVFRARDEPDGHDVIVKFPKPATGADPVLRLAFLREAWIAARINSPFVAEVIEPADGRRSCLYTVMPFYRGETLEQRLRRQPRIGLREGLGIAERLAKGVAALHRAGVIHRDIKPDNVLLEEAGGLKLLDLGVARLPGMDDFPAADTPGTPSYMAPEMFAGAAGEAGSDIYALGVTVYRMFAGAYPYGEIEPFSRPRFSRPPASLLAHRPDLPAWLDQALARAVAVRPEERFADVVEFMFALEHGALHAVPAGPRRRPLLQRDPLMFWQTVAALLALALAAALVSR
jgi:serine/threonine protein phosphatase PrpC